MPFYRLSCTYSLGHNILVHVDVWPNFPFITSETKLIISNKQNIYDLHHELPNVL